MQMSAGTCFLPFAKSRCLRVLVILEMNLSSLCKESAAHGAHTKPHERHSRRHPEARPSTGHTGFVQLAHALDNAAISSEPHSSL